MSLSLYLVKEIGKIGYDEYDSWVVAAESHRQALAMTPSKIDIPTIQSDLAPWSNGTASTYIGKAAVSIHKPTVICASFNAG